MTLEPSASYFSSQFLHEFVELTVREVGAEKLALVLAMADMSVSVTELQSLEKIDASEAAKVYATLQQALRLYYGHGARGILLRIGRNLWDNMTGHAPFWEKAELRIARALPVPSRRKHVLEMVAGWLQAEKGSNSVHLLDVDLLLVDRGSVASWKQSNDEPVCFVTLGLIQGALFWATGREADVEEISCRAMGAPACEFKVKIGG